VSIEEIALLIEQRLDLAKELEKAEEKMRENNHEINQLIAEIATIDTEITRLSKRLP